MNGTKVTVNLDSVDMEGMGDFTPAELVRNVARAYNAPNPF